jgi:hypothetical protein
MQHKYDIKAGEQFNANSCPLVMSQLVALQEGMTGLPRINKDDIVISFLKDHSINNDWIASNPEVARQMIAGLLAVSQIEAYFEGCKDNKTFLTEFEKVIRATFEGTKQESKIVAV